jgi:hypothetical protein
MLGQVNFLAAKRGKTKISDAIIATCSKSGHEGSLNQPDTVVSYLVDLGWGLLAPF